MAPADYRLPALRASLPAAIQAAVNADSERWQREGIATRIWAKDSAVWTGADESQWLGWLGIVPQQLAAVADFAEFAADMKQAGFQHVVVLGMGGSSLCPDVLRQTFPATAGFPKLLVLDSVVPAQVLTIDRSIDPAKTVFIVASKSGSTIEPNVLKQYFQKRVADTVGADAAGLHFVAVTDPGTKMDQIAQAERFRKIFYGLPTIGGRYSALSNFGMIPAVARGLDVPHFLRRAKLMVDECGPGSIAKENPGVALGLILGHATLAGHDKATLIASPQIGLLGAWLEQLLAESLGKIGKGLVPIDDEALATQDHYGKDRLFAYVRLENGADPQQDALVAGLESAGHPVVRITMPTADDLGGEFFRWEFATAVAGAVLKLHPFDQPDVEAAKIAARKVTTAFEETGSLPPESPIFSKDGFDLYADSANAAALQTSKPQSLVEHLDAHLRRIKPGDYFAVNAYIEQNAANAAHLRTLRLLVRDAFKVATTVGYGPRFLHSTGQLHKGGPNTGVFLQITSDDATDVSIPGQKLSFGVLKRAQAQGDFQVLCERGRRILRVNLPAAVEPALAKLVDAIKAAL